MQTDGRNRPIRAKEQSPAKPSTPETASQAERRTRPAGLAGVALMLPVLAIGLYFLVDSTLGQFLVSLTAVLVTSLLLWLDARQFGADLNRDGRLSYNEPRAVTSAAGRY